MDFCSVVGSFGCWQLRLFLFFAFLNIVGMWQNFAILFLAGHVPFRCVQPPHDNASLPFDDRCQVVESPNSSVPCTRWEYDTSHTSQTIVSEWDLVCGREWLVSFAKSTYMFGYLLSVIVFGQISDCVGRYPTIVACYVITCISMFLTLLSNSFTMFVVLRFFQAFGRTGATTVGFVLLMESVGPKYHEEVGIAIQFGFSVGYVTLAGVAWFFRHWFWLQLVISLTFLPFALALCVVPESPRWLQTRGKIERLKRLLATAARVNGRQLKAEASEFLERKDLEEVKNETSKTATMFEVMKLPNLRKRTFKMIYLWFVNAFMYYAVAYSTSDLAGDPYVNCFLAGLVEVPAKGLVFFGVKKWGRRPTLVLNMALAGAFFLADLPAGVMIDGDLKEFSESRVMRTIAIDIPWLNTVFAMASKLCVTGSFAVLYLYTTEVFPTGVRNTALGTCSMCARIGSILAPFLRDLGKVIPPSAINAFLALTGALLALTLPETRGLELPDTLQEGEDLGQLAKKSGENKATLSQSVESHPLTEQ